MTRGRSFPQTCMVARGTACPPELTRTHQLVPLLSEALTGTQPNRSSNALTPGELLTVRSVNPAHPSKKNRGCAGNESPVDTDRSLSSPTRRLVKVALERLVFGTGSGCQVGAGLPEVSGYGGAVSSQTLGSLLAADPHFWVQGTRTGRANQGVTVPLQGE